VIPIGKLALLAICLFLSKDKIDLVAVLISGMVLLL
jgi:hypothetical protein